MIFNMHYSPNNPAKPPEAASKIGPGPPNLCS